MTTVKNNKHEKTINKNKDFNQFLQKMQHWQVKRNDKVKKMNEDQKWPDQKWGSSYSEWKNA